MTLSPEQWAEVKERAAELIVAMAQEEAAKVTDLIILPFSFITQVTGLSRHSIPQKMAITKTADGKFGVTMKNLTVYLDERTTGPTPKAKAGAATPASAK